MNTIPSQITSLTIVYLTVNSGTDQRKHQSSASLAFVRGIHRRPVNSPHKGPVTRKMFPFDDVIMESMKNRPSHSHTTIFEVRLQSYNWLCTGLFTILPSQAIKLIDAMNNGNFDSVCYLTSSLNCYLSPKICRWRWNYGIASNENLHHS